MDYAGAEDGAIKKLILSEINSFKTRVLTETGQSISEEVHSVLQKQRIFISCSTKHSISVCFCNPFTRIYPLGTTFIA